VKVRRSEDYLIRMISMISNSDLIKAKLSHQITESYWHKLHLKALELLNKIPHVERGGRNPYVFAASIIYAAERSLAYEENRRPLLTQKEVASILEVAEYSIRDHYSHITKYISLT
jgi:transcription initiation factor TFIIIB Brf1 subunit/transcription initiation factor TFIIB